MADVENKMSSKLCPCSLLLLLALPTLSFPQGLIPPRLTAAQSNQQAMAYWTYLRVGQRHETGYRFAEAEQQYQLAHNLAKTLFGDQSDEAVIALNHLGMMRSEQGRIGDADRTFRQVLKILEARTETSRLDIAGVLNNLAIVRQMSGNYSGAAALMRRVIGVLETEPAAEQENVGISLANLAATLRETGALPEAMSTARKAISILERYQDSENLPVSLITLSQLHMDSGDFAAAEATLQRARECAENRNEAGSPTLALVFAHLAVIYGKIGRHLEAEPYFQRAIEINQRFFAPEHPRLLNSMSAYADFLRATKRKAEARKLEAYVREHREQYRLQNPTAGKVVDVSSLMKK
jgi:tetratricopeptide (TPR) repeat protein